MRSFSKLFVRLILFIILLPGQSFAQVLKLSGSERDTKVFNAYIESIRQSDKSAGYGTLAKLISEVQREGYFAARVLSDTVAKDTLYASIVLGDQFEWAHLRPGNLGVMMQEKAGFREKFFVGKPFRYHEVAVLFDKIVKQAENTGYPFAIVKLTNIHIAQQRVHATVNYQPGPKITYGRLQLTGDAKVKSTFLEAYLKIMPGSLYDERKIKQIPDIIQDLPFVSLAAPVKVTFQNETADVILNLTAVESNSADGIINLMPAEGKEKSLLLTGEFNIQLNNLWQSGKVFGLHWQRLQIASQQLNLNYQHTRLFSLPLDAAVSFSMLKEDTLFYNRKMFLSLIYPFGTKHISTSVGWQNSRLLEGTAISEAALTTDMANFDLLNFSTIFTYQEIDRKYYPKQGYRILFGGGIGRKSIKPNVYTTSDSTGEIASDIVTVNQQALQTSVEYYQNIGNDGLIFQKLSGANLFGKNLFLNDLYRIGGMHSLRGFYDNFFFASQYVLSNLELRLLFEQTKETYSYLLLFYDQAYIATKTSSSHTTDYPFGIGAGISLNTSAGVFSLVYGVGKSSLQPFNIQYSKIHFGYTSRF